MFECLLLLFYWWCLNKHWFCWSLWIWGGRISVLVTPSPTSSHILKNCTQDSWEGGENETPCFCLDLQCTWDSLCQSCTVCHCFTLTTVQLQFTIECQRKRNRLFLVAITTNEHQSWIAVLFFCLCLYVCYFFAIRSQVNWKSNCKLAFSGYIKVPYVLDQRNNQFHTWFVMVHNKVHCWTSGFCYGRFHCLNLLLK